ncbi:hypothetical protein K402DRAFT_303024, partial [Aulographum hederae CBS 113979]
MRNAAYGPTKLVVHWLTNAIYFEVPELTAFPIDPGWVQTEMGNRGANDFGVESALAPVSESCAGMVKVIDAATKET